MVTVAPIAPIITEQTVVERRYLRVSDAAQYSGLSESEIYRCIYAGQLRALKYKSRSWLITREDLDSWLEAQCTPNVAA
jgi:excisionase family DNA binding protein